MTWCFISSFLDLYLPDLNHLQPSVGSIEGPPSLLWNATKVLYFLQTSFKNAVLNVNRSVLTPYSCKLSGGAGSERLMEEPKILERSCLALIDGHSLDWNIGHCTLSHSCVVPQTCQKNLHSILALSDTPDTDTIRLLSFFLTGNLSWSTRIFSGRMH